MITDKRAEQLSKKKWKTRDGTIMTWKEMDVKHLRNAAAMVRRNGEEYENKAWQFSSMVQGDMATYYADMEVNHACDVADRAKARAEMMESYADWRAVHPDLPENVFYV